ncbi:hypothetical protein [Azospirillum doebereinerae]
MPCAQKQGKERMSKPLKGNQIYLPDYKRKYRNYHIVYNLARGLRMV